MSRNPPRQQVVSFFNVTHSGAIFITIGQKKQFPDLFLREGTFCQAANNFPSACTFVVNGQSHVFKLFAREVF